VATPPPGPTPTGGAGAPVPLLACERVRLEYGSARARVTAVADATFEVDSHEKVILIGRSGCGKSTVLKAVAGYIQPTGGSIVFGGRRRLEPGPDRAVVFQEFDQLFPWRTVIDNVAYPLRVNGRSRAEAAHQAASQLETMGLSSARDRYPHQLSGGMKQRVAIARALALSPLMLLMDEPFGSLDALTRSKLQQELKAVAERTAVTILFVTHSIDEALILGDRVVVLDGSPSRVKESVDVRGVGTPGTAGYREAARHLEELLGIEARGGEVE
jgi:NitT/TauT family transport system ATP-binding protein